MKQQKNSAARLCWHAAKFDKQGGSARPPVLTAGAHRRSPLLQEDSTISEAQMAAVLSDSSSYPSSPSHAGTKWLLVSAVMKGPWLSVVS